MEYVFDNTNKIIKIFLNLMNKGNQLREFIKSCKDINYKDELGRTMLHYAVLNENLDAVKVLLELDANVNEVDNDLRTPMHYLAVVGNEKIAEYIVKNRDISCEKDLYGQTPMCLAKWRGNTKVANVLKGNKKYKNIKAS